jgi:hypothetical protein
MIMENKGLSTKSHSLGKIVVHSKKNTHLTQSYVTSIYSLCTHKFLAINTTCGAFYESISKIKKLHQNLCNTYKSPLWIRFQRTFHETFTLSFDVYSQCYHESFSTICTHGLEWGKIKILKFGKMDSITSFLFHLTMLSPILSCK